MEEAANGGELACRLTEVCATSHSQNIRQRTDISSVLGELSLGNSKSLLWAETESVHKILRQFLDANHWICGKRDNIVLRLKEDASHLFGGKSRVCRNTDIGNHLHGCAAICNGPVGVPAGKGFYDATDLIILDEFI